MLAAGLRAGHGWTNDHAAEYLAALPGAVESWTPAELAKLLTEFP
jgi:hypothetical protein